MQLASKQAVLEDVLELDPAQEGPQEVERVTVDFYIVYSSTYRVPVLYFNAFDQGTSFRHGMQALILSSWISPDVGPHPSDRLPYVKE